MAGSDSSHTTAGSQAPGQGGWPATEANATSSDNGDAASAAKEAEAPAAKLGGATIEGEVKKERTQQG